MPKKCYSNLSFRDLIKLQTEQVIRPLTTYQISLKILDPWKSEWNAFNKNYTQDFFEMIQIKITLLYHPSIQYLKEEKIWREKKSNIVNIDCVWTLCDWFFGHKSYLNQ